MVQFWPQSTGQLSIAYNVSSSAAGCWSAGPQGHIRLRRILGRRVVWIMFVAVVCSVVVVRFADVSFYTYLFFVVVRAYLEEVLCDPEGLCTRPCLPWCVT